MAYHVVDSWEGNATELLVVSMFMRREIVLARLPKVWGQWAMPK
jgi:hypothetical protein